MAAIPQVPLGKTGLSVPVLGIGIWSWGDYMFWGYGKEYTETENRAAFDVLMAAGLNFFDTAEVYGLGQSESFLGRFLKASGRQAFIATKFFPFPFRLTDGRLMHALRGSLRRLQVPQADLYQLHQPIPPRTPEGWMGAMAKAMQAGLTRAVGVSNYSVDWTRRAHQALARHGIPLASNQVSFSLLQRKPERTGLMALCRDLGVSVIAYSPLGMGILSGRYTPDNPPPGFRASRYPREFLERIAPLLGLMREIGQAHGGRPNVQVAINWVIAKGAIPIPGVKNIRQAQDAVGSLEWTLDSAEVAALDAASHALS